MIEEILLLTDPAMVDDLEAILLAANPGLRIVRVQTLAHLETICPTRRETTRLISFGSEIIVPATVLKRLGAGAYNFHPGPPSHPGRFPSCFFIYQGGTRFGTTVHEMAARVDSGPISAVDWFDAQPDIDRRGLDSLTFGSLLKQFERLAPHLATRPEALPHIDVVWSGRTTTQRDFEALCRLPANVDETEFRRRYRAIGEGPDHALEITLFGHRFGLDNRHPDTVVTVGGKVR